MTDQLRQAAQQALEALEGLFGLPNQWESGGVAVWRLGGSDASRQAITALRAALEQQAEPVQERITHITWDERGVRTVNGIPDDAPQQQQAEPVTREGFEKWAKFAAPYMDISRFGAGYSDCNTDYAWVGWQAAQRKELSASEILNMMPSGIPAEYDGELMEFARAVEAKLKEKNGY